MVECIRVPQNQSSCDTNHLVCPASRPAGKDTHSVGAIEPLGQFATGTVVGLGR